MNKLIFRQLFDFETCTYTYLLADPVSKEALLIDTVLEQTARDLSLLRELGLSLKFIFETHVHADHITGAAVLREATGAKVGVGHEAKVSCADISIVDQQEFRLGNITVKAIATPGHTNTCTSYYTSGMLFTGDALLIRDVGRTDFQQGSNEKMYESLTRKIFPLPPETFIYPGHDYYGRTSSSIEEERKFNAKVGGGNSFEKFSTLMAEMKLAKPKRIDIAVPANLQCGKVG